MDGLCPYGYACPDKLTALNAEITTVDGYNLRSTELVQLYMGHMDYTVVTLSWANISANLTYGTEFELYVYSNLTLDSNGAPVQPWRCLSRSPRPTSHSTPRCASRSPASSTPPSALSVGVLHGLYLPQAQDFVNSGTVSIIQPDRAITQHARHVHGGVRLPGPVAVPAHQHSAAGLPSWCTATSCRAVTLDPAVESDSGQQR